jgi:hypothetical protein
LHAYIRRRVNPEYTCDKLKLKVFSFCAHLVLRNWYKGALRDEIPVRVWSQLSQYDLMHLLRGGLRITWVHLKEKQDLRVRVRTNNRRPAGNEHVR